MNGRLTNGRLTNGWLEALGTMAASATNAASEPASAALDVLNDKTRRALLEQLRHGECSVRELTDASSVSQPAISQHLRVLHGAGLIAVRPEGRRRIYRIDLDGFASVRAWVDSFWDDALDSFVAHVEAEHANAAKDKTTQGKTAKEKTAKKRSRGKNDE